MKIKKITNQIRRDFDAILICEHCGTEDELNGGYDDRNYHENVIPQFKCPKCGKTAGSDYRSLSTKHPEGMQI